MANRWGEQLPRLKCFDHAVLDELPGQLLMGVQDRAFVVQAFDLEAYRELLLLYAMAKDIVEKGGSAAPSGDVYQTA